MTNVELFKIFRPLLMRVTGVPEMILADPNASAPKGTYAAVRIDDSIVQYGQSIQRQVVTDRQSIVTEIERQFRKTIVVDFYREGSVGFATKIAEFQKLPSVMDVLQRNNIGVHHVSNVNNLTTLFAAMMEERANVTIEIWYTSKITDEINTIEHANIIIEDEKDRTLAEFEVTLYD